MVVGVFGPSLAFTGSITKQAFSTLATTDDRSGYHRFITILRIHLEKWIVRGPEPVYSVRHPLIAENGPRRPVELVRRTRQRAGRGNGMTGARGGLVGIKIRDVTDGGGREMTTTADFCSGDMVMT